ncbi:MAG: hypothetical protein GY861_21560 [bacterium]|nr:hypothetical protein [bacterium]
MEVLDLIESVLVSKGFPSIVFAICSTIVTHYGGLGEDYGAFIMFMAGFYCAIVGIARIVNE